MIVEIFAGIIVGLILTLLFAVWLGGVIILLSIPAALLKIFSKRR